MDTQYQPVVAEERSGAGTLFRIMDRGAPDLSRGWSTRTKIRSGGRNICPLLCQHCRWIPSRTNPHLSIICHEAVLPAKVSPFSQKLSSTVNTKQARRCRSLFPGRYHRADSHQDDPGQKPSGNSAHCPMKPPVSTSLTVTAPPAMRTRIGRGLSGAQTRDVSCPALPVPRPELPT